MLRKIMNKALALLTAAVISLAWAAAADNSVRAYAYNYDKITGAKNVTGYKNVNYQKVITINVVDKYGADNTGRRNTSAALQKALDYARDNANDFFQVKVVIPAGNYLVDKTLYVYSNTYISMDGAVLKKAFPSGGCILRNAQPKQVGGYDDAHNIIIKGGCFDGNVQSDYKNFCNVRLGHLNNVLLEGVSFTCNLNTHHIELGGAKDITITGCDFSDYRGTYIKEAIQFDIMNNANVFSGFEPFDDTICENVIIRGNSFRNVMRGIGSHSATLGKYYKDFLIENNTFTNITDCAILMQSYKNITVSGNTMNNVGSGIIVRNMSPSKSNAGYYSPVDDSNIGSSLNNDLNTVIKNNQINANVTSARPSPVGIQLFGKLIETGDGKDFDYQVEGVRITNNTLKIPGTCIEMNDVTGIKVDSNKLSYTGSSCSDFDLINVQYSSDTLFSGNTTVTPADGSFSVSSGRVYLQDMTLSNKSDGCCGVRSGKNGSVFGWDLTVHSAGAASSVIYAEKGSGNMVISGGSYSSGGEDSPAAESDSVIAISEASLKGGKSEAVRIANPGMMYIYNCQLSTDVKKSDDGLTAAAVLYGNSPYGAEDKLSRLYVEGGSISSRGDVIFTTNCKSEIILKGTKLSSDRGGYLLKCVSDPTRWGWGRKYSGGAVCSLILMGQELYGQMLCDSLSTLNILVSKGSTYRGTPESASAGTLCGDRGNISVSVDESSVWVIDRDCTVSELHAAGEIKDIYDKAVNITDAEGNILREGDSAFSVTVTGEYSQTSESYDIGNSYSFEDFRMSRAEIDPAMLDDEEDTPEEYKRGDVNGNGRVDISDVTIIASYIKQKRNFPDPGTRRRADVNNDGLVNTKDLLLVAAAVKGVRPLL
ncbi:glycosyl hydrolase family 28-related protein [Ruminococcus albus]|uniref:Probable pectate lyase C n=1 Tax=Ruminococcus albus TaxID=1264 RepID=A0A1H7HVJ6_RUMAL|nr:glycosyl hydrolase family 28-related protein [Ruminococcus albus]SEK52245.1 Pectate lyase superfamily protein [Ruminococcus albus]